MAFELNSKFGIKEVADVAFYEPGTVTLDTDGAFTATGDPKFTSDSMKVSTFEFTGENVSARGGKGNAEIISWDFNKEITLNLEDAVITPESLALRYGTETPSDVSKPMIYTIGADTFPGTYSVIGKTFIRDEDGKDYLYSFFVPKMKVQPESTLTMEAEGDPTTFSFTGKVMKAGGTSNSTYGKAVKSTDMVVYVLDITNAVTPEDKAKKLAMPVAKKTSEGGQLSQ